jgi:hypothetical protein
MKTIHVLGLGPGIEKYKNTGKIYTVGVNNIHDYYNSDVVICLDKIGSFDVEKFKTIRYCKPELFISQLREWSYIRDCSLIELDDKIPGRGGLLDKLDYDLPVYPFHVDSTFTAVCFAYRFLKIERFKYNKSQSIIMFGCRFYGHSQLQHFIKEIQNCYSTLFIELKKRNVTLYNADPESALKDILPFYEV